MTIRQKMETTKGCLEVFKDPFTAALLYHDIINYARFFNFKVSLSEDTEDTNKWNAICNMFNKSEEHDWKWFL